MLTCDVNGFGITDYRDVSAKCERIWDMAFFHHRRMPSLFGNLPRQVLLAKPL